MIAKIQRSSNAIGLKGPNGELNVSSKEDNV